jgi:hypothetical protein
MSLAMWLAILLFVTGTSAPIIISKLKPKDEVKLDRKKVIQITS